MQAFLAPVTVSTGQQYVLARSVVRPLCGQIRTTSYRRAFLPTTPIICEASDSEQKSDDKSSAPGAEAGDDGTTSASEILKTLREDSAADMALKEQEPENERSSRTMLGVYRDVDGRSNVWAVEPKEETDTRPQVSKVLLIGFSAAIIIIILLILPSLPLYNPDQV